MSKFIKISLFGDILWFVWTFKMAVIRHFGYLKVWMFSGTLGSEGQYALPYQISPVKLFFWDIAIFRIFKMAASAILELVGTYLDCSRRVLGSLYHYAQNLVAINAVVLIIWKFEYLASHWHLGDVVRNNNDFCCFWSVAGNIMDKLFRLFLLIYNCQACSVEIQTYCRVSLTSSNIYTSAHVVAGGIIFYCWSFFLFLFFLSTKDLRDGSTDREPL